MTNHPVIIALSFSPKVQSLNTSCFITSNLQETRINGINPNYFITLYPLKEGPFSFGLLQSRIGFPFPCRLPRHRHGRLCVSDAALLHLLFRRPPARTLSGVLRIARCRFGCGLGVGDFRAGDASRVCRYHRRYWRKTPRSRLHFEDTVSSSSAIHA